MERLPFYAFFDALCHVPRPSHHEEKVGDFLCTFAQTHHLYYKRDEHSCVVISKPASPGKEQALPVVLQAHADMVCVAEAGKTFRPTEEGIEVYEDHGWLRARGTSLGADNGMGLAMALAVLADDTLVHGPLELLVTTNEEDGMSGAQGLAPDFFQGRTVINLDSEAYDEMTVEAAGALILTHTYPYREIRYPKDYLSLSLTVTGGRGGHSGVDIARGRANCIKVLANILHVAIRHAGVRLYLVHIEGGDAAASIPSQARAVVCLPCAQEQAFRDIVIQGSCALQTQYADTDPDLDVWLEAHPWHGNVLSEDATRTLLAALNAIPTGPLEMRDATTPLTSNNIGTITMGASSEGKHIVLTTHSRSFKQSDMDLLGQKIRQIMEVCGATVHEEMNAPAWQEDTDHPLLQLTSEVFADTLGFRPRPVAMHFVLESGYLVKKFKGLHIASIGPRILSPHSTSERVECVTCDNIYRVLLALLARLSQYETLSTELS